MSLSRFYGAPVNTKILNVFILMFLFSCGIKIGNATECNLSYSQLSTEALEVLRKKFPERKFEIGAAPGCHPDGGSRVWASESSVEVVRLPELE